MDSSIVSSSVVHCPVIPPGVLAPPPPTPPTGSIHFPGKQHALSKLIIVQRQRRWHLKCLQLKLHEYSCPFQVDNSPGRRWTNVCSAGQCLARQWEHRWRTRSSKWARNSVSFLSAAFLVALLWRILEWPEDWVDAFHLLTIVMCSCCCSWSREHPPEHGNISDEKLRSDDNRRWGRRRGRNGRRSVDEQNRTRTCMNL